MKRNYVSQYRRSFSIMLPLPSEVTSLLAKGPRYRIPPNLNEKFLENLHLDLEIFSRQVRWKHKITSQKFQNFQNLEVPFERNTVLMPPSMTAEKEKQLTLLKAEILRETKKEISKIKQNDKYKKIVTKTFVKPKNS